METCHWQIAEPLQFGWTDELVYLDCPAALADPAAITALHDGAQLVAAQYDPARQAVVAALDVQPLEQRTLTPCSEAAPDTGLRVEERPGLFLLRNTHGTVALAREARVTDAGDRWSVSGPLAYVIGPDGRTRGGSRLLINKSRFLAHDRESIARLHPEQIAAEETPPTVAMALEARGPVFARYRYTLTLSTGAQYTFTATLYAAHPALYVQEETNLGHDGALEIAVSDGFPCDQYFFGGVDVRESQRVLPLPATQRLGSLSPHHTQTHTAYAWLGFTQSPHPQGGFHGMVDTGVEPFADTLLFMAYRPWTWRYPGEMTLQFTTDAGGHVTARGGVRRGMRSWCLFITDRAVLHQGHPFNFGEEAREVSPFAVWHRRLNDLPFDWVRRLDLDSGAPSPAQFPTSVLTREEYAAKRAELFPALSAALEPLWQQQLQQRMHPDTVLAIHYTRWLMQGDLESARVLAQAIQRVMEAKLTLALHSGFLADAMSAVSNRCLGPNAVYFEACIAAGVLSPEEITRLRRIFLLFAHASAEDALFPSHQNYLTPDDPRSIRNWSTAEQYSDLFGTPNFQTDVYYNLALFGAVFQGHPRSRAWLEDAARQFDAQLDYHFHPGGVYEESIGYFSHLFHNMLSLASVLKRQGVRDFYTDQRFQDAMGCFVDYLGAPRTATVERMVFPGKDAPEGLMRFWPAIGDTGHNCAEAQLQPMVAHAAWEVREHNPALSDRLLAVWTTCGSPLWSGHGPQFEPLYFREIAPTPPPLTLASRQFVNIGVMLRADVGQPSETSLFVRSGRATHHWGFDHGHFTLASRGSLLIPDYGYYGTTEPAGGDFVHGSASWVHNIVTFGPDWNGGLGMERFPQERAVALGGEFQYVEVDMSMNNVRHSVWRNIQPIVPIEYIRHLVFAQNRYVFVWDRIDFSIYPSQLRINALAQAVSGDGHQLRFTGLDGVDLQVTLCAPAQAEFFEGIVGPQRYVLYQQNCQCDYQWVCQPLGAGEQAFTVVQREHVITISGTDLHRVAFTDHYVCAKGDFGATVEIDGVSYRLDGHLAVVHQQDGITTTELLCGTGFMAYATV